MRSIRDLLTDRQEGEHLHVFDESAFKSMRETINFLQANARAVVGPHGGGLYHHRFTGRDTLVLELMPENFREVMFFEEASLLGQVYRPMAFSVNGTGTDFHVDVEGVLEVLGGQLGRRDDRGESVKEDYRWDAVELGLRDER